MPLEPPRLLDDRNHPDFRATYGALLTDATHLDVALTHLRLSTVDLTERELGRITRVRLLLAEVSAAALDAEAHALLHSPHRAGNLRRLIALVAQERVEVRSAPLAGWTPDFSIFGAGGKPFSLLVGPHRFGGEGLGGPAFVSVHSAREAVRAAGRFEELWSRAHDVRPAIAGILTRAEERRRTRFPAMT